MMYQEEEVACYETRRRLNWARRRVPEFSQGDVDYSVAPFAPEVFSCLRYTNTGAAVGLANLSGKRISGTVPLTAREPIYDGTNVYDAVSGRNAVIRDAAFPWTLEPYENGADSYRHASGR